MILYTEPEVANTREKLRELEAFYETRRSCKTLADPWLHEQSLLSLHRLIVKMKEDIVRFESHRLLQQAGHK